MLNEGVPLSPVTLKSISLVPPDVDLNIVKVLLLTLLTVNVVEGEVVPTPNFPPTVVFPVTAKVSFNVVAPVTPNVLERVVEPTTFNVPWESIFPVEESTLNLLVLLLLIFKLFFKVVIPVTLNVEFKVVARATSKFPLKSPWPDIVRSPSKLESPVIANELLISTSPANCKSPPMKQSPEILTPPSTSRV